MNMIPPCKGCEDRKMLCHSSCEKYLEWKKFRDEVNQRMREYKEKSFTEYRKYRG